MCSSMEEKELHLNVVSRKVTIDDNAGFEVGGCSFQLMGQPEALAAPVEEPSVVKIPRLSRDYRALTKLSWNGIQNLVLHGGTQAAEHIRSIPSGNAWAKIFLNCVHWSGYIEFYYDGYSL